MKKLLLLAALFALPFTVFSQTTMSVDSVVVRPVNPDANDSVWVHIFGFSPYGTALNGPITVSTSATYNHIVNACYTVGMISVVTYIHDSVFVFQGPAGMHTISWAIVQNGSQATSCDQLVDAGQMTVNVTTVLGVEEQNNASLLSWNASLQSLSCAAAGTLSVYSVNGQLLLRRDVAPNTLVALPQNARDMVIAVLEDEAGRSGRVKISLQ